MNRLKIARDAALKLVKTRMESMREESIKDEPDINTLQIQRNTLGVTFEEYQDYCLKVMEFMLDEECTALEYEKERKALDKNMEAFNRTCFAVDKLTEKSPAGSHYSTASEMSSVTKKRNFKLPKIEMRKFSGELLDWLGWWSQFMKIHDDNEIHVTDKFHYLLQAMGEGTRAKDLVESYPMMEDNYPKVIKALKQRFGKKKILKQVYVRELLKIVINNSKSSEKVVLSKMYDKLESHLRALETLGVTTEQTAEFIFPMVESSLPEDILVAWQRSTLYGQDGSKQEPPKTELDFLMKFLRQEVELQLHSNFNNNNYENVTAAGLFSSFSQSCIFCDKSSHQSQDCFKAQVMTLRERNEKVRDKKSCFVCLRPGHQSRDCKSNVKCILCKKKHVVIMCPDLEQKKHSSTKPTKDETKAVMTSHECASNILLQTLLVDLINEDGSKSRRVRLIFDTGSQGTCVRRDTAERLGLKPLGEVWSRKVLYGGTLTEKQKHQKFQIRIASLNRKVTRDLIALDEPEICGRLQRVKHGPWIRELSKQNIYLNDYKSESHEIEILVGCDYFGQFMTGKIIQLKCGLTAMESIFGWTLSGKIPEEGSSSALLTLTAALMSCQSSVSDLWSLETIGIMDSVQVKSRTEREEATRLHFQQTVSRNNEGRYSVKLPWVQIEPNIPDNKTIAYRRLESTTRKLIDSKKYEVYDQIFQDWIKEDFVEVVGGEDSPGKRIHYIPHHAVFKPQSLTTPVRPVFDASCKIGRSPSLNDCLEKGPNLLELIPSILLRFRKHQIGFVSDIRKAFQMINVDEGDQDFLRFLWWEDYEKKKIKILRHKRVVFGINCSPFLLGAVLNKHLEVVEEDQDIAQKLLISLYVDNCVSSVDTIEEYEDFKEKSTSLLATAKMELRQWERNTVGGSGIGVQARGLEHDSSFIPQDLTTVLGLLWDKKEDNLRISIPQEEIHGKLTKRVILSQVQKIFDPMGYLSPATLVPKLLLQKAWLQKTSWDEEVNEELEKEFMEWWLELKYLEKVHIKRNAFGNIVKNKDVQLHTFCDASKKAYAAAVFVRIDDGDGVEVHLLQAKSRVAPLKESTIPRLELLGCTIAARLLHSVQEALSLEGVRSFLWSDSSTALAWIRRNDEWGTFVGNRVKEICTTTTVEQWNFVPGHQNPADLPSRGCKPSQLIKSRWWEGPKWLKSSKEEWPQHKEEYNEELIKQGKKKCAISMMQMSESKCPWFIERYSSYNKNLRQFAWITRFINNCRKITSEKSKDLSVLEIEEAERKWFKLVQMDSFPDSKLSVISGLKTEKDEHGIIRVKSKLLYRPDSEYFRRPILLPHSHPLVNQLITEEHVNNGHGGAQFLMGHLREKVWIIQSRRAIKKIISKCVICRRFTTKARGVTEAPLPSNTVKKIAIKKKVQDEQEQIDVVDEPGVQTQSGKRVKKPARFQ